MVRNKLQFLAALTAVFATAMTAETIEPRIASAADITDVLDAADEVYLEDELVSDPFDISLKPITDLIETTIYRNTTEKDKYEHIGDAEVVFANKIIFDEEAFERCPNLKYIGVCATGYNVIDLEAAGRHGVTVTNVPAYSTESVTQLTWGFILECASRMSLHDKSVHSGDWIRSETFCYWLAPVTELAGKTLGIVGYGNIGRRVAEIADAFRMKTLFFGKIVITMLTLCAF